MRPSWTHQGQIIPNDYKRNQKLVKKVEYNQLVEITTFFNFQIPGLRIRRPQVQILPGLPIKTVGYRFISVAHF